jgi:xylulokinase
MADRVVLALDCGSTNLKAALYSSSLDLLGEASEPMVYTEHGPDRYEFDAAPFWQTTVRVMRTVCEQAGVSASSVTDVALSSQAQTFVFVDGEGRAVTPVVSWLDRTAVAESLAAKARLGDEFHRHCSFSEPIPQLQLCKVRQCLARNPDLASARLVSLPGLVGLRLGGANTTDENLAAMGGLYSLAHGTWWSEGTAFAGLSAEQLPALVPLGGGLSIMDPDPDLGFSSGLRVAFCGNDQTCGAYGNGVDEGTILATLGTALVAYRCAGTEAGPYRDGTFWGPYPGRRYYELATRDEGCLALDWVRRERFENVGIQEFDALASGFAETVADHAALFWPAETGVLPDTEDPAEAAYATLEGIGFALRELLEDGLGVPRGTVVKLAGGGGKSAVWRQIIADVLDSPVMQAGGDSLLGAAAMALGKELAADDGECCHPRPDLVAILERRYRRWRGHE